ncbi:MAG TPA: methyl-accepting chemotaxis protein [Desulfomonilia bacterium]|nr:methyl-accepting chemotaxis protein [Desulfomonilia bacterium]
MITDVKLSTKLVIVGSILILIPIIIVGSLSVDKYSRGLEAIQNELLISDTKLLAQAVDRTLIGEMRLVKDLSTSPETVRAASSHTNYGYPLAQNDIDALNARLIRFGQTEGARENRQIVYVTDREGKAFAGSVDQYIGTSFSESGFMKDTLSGKAIIGRPDINRAIGELFVPVAAPIYSPEGKVVGAVTEILSMGVLNDLISKTRIGRKGYAWMIDKEGRFIVHPDKEYLLKLNIMTLPGMRGIAKKMLSGQTGVEHYMLKGISNASGFAPVSMTGWSIGCSLPEEEFRARSEEVRDFVIMAGVISFIAVFILLYLFSKFIGKGIKRVVDLAGQVEDVDLAADVDINRKDEIGRIADAMRNNAARIRAVMTDIHGIAGNVAERSNDLISIAEKISEAADGQASAVRGASACMENMGSTIRRNTDNTRQAEEIASKLANDAKAAENAIGETVSAMKSIAGKVAAIEDITRQTNLLGLVAAMEAAKAGAQGKGPAVAIAEIRRLVEKLADTAGEASNLSTNSIDVALQAGKNLSQAMPDIHMTALLMQEINTVSIEHNAGAEKIDSAVRQLKELILQNESNSRKLFLTIDEISHQAALLQKAVSSFTINREAEGTITTVFRKRSSGKPDQVLPKTDREKFVGDAPVIKNYDEDIPRLADLLTNMGNPQNRGNKEGDEHQ